ncbi:membrane-associated s in eicosanoid and glutathione metabolism [Chlorella sorokiniana]|uniref:Glutathione S-transferase 3, mitochondrial n=1 Tax=Chlorella sorokiniana TaxID=3076 RepID=A0A2P6TNT4_CHLSO|nr:membrane-associated s in eicosanoid and glutathione metabolism [Chlorella sorokiniana]|eukprot:PRW50988.1 membrane-associated s in eicosanoid and glutathione metabolism [Chlorella sorokiniana]
MIATACLFAAPQRLSQAGRTVRPGSRALVVRALAVPDQYGYVMASVALTTALVQWQAIRVAIARKKVGLSYPKMIAEGDSEEARVFNCTQRSHQNTLEYFTGVVAMQALLGLQYPVVAAAAGTAWTLARVAYTLGYSTGDPSKRGPGAIASGLIHVLLILGTGVTGVRIATGL